MDETSAVDEILAAAAAAWATTDPEPLVQELTGAVAASKLAVHRLYFTPIVGMMTFSRLLVTLNYARWAEGQLLMRVIIAYGDDEAALISALQRAYGPGEP